MLFFTESLAEEQFTLLNNCTWKLFPT